MIASVSTFARISGTLSPSSVVNSFMPPPPVPRRVRVGGEVPHVHEVTGDGRRRRHRRTDQMGATALPLAALEVAVRGRGAALPGSSRSAVHRQAHRAARLAPLEARLAKEHVEPLLLGLPLHQARARHDHGLLDGVGDLAPLDDRRGRAQVLDARVRARADEHPVETDVGDRGVRLEVHVGERAADAVGTSCARPRARRGSARGRRPGRPSPGRCPRRPAARWWPRRCARRDRTRRPSSLTSVRQAASALSQVSPFGANGRSRR